jgi:hypothetical protein
MRIRDGDSSDPGWKEVGSGIRDKHPGSATLILFNPVIRSFTVGAPVRQKIRELWEDKSSKPF